ncbi:hypothetical protein DUNSADRAFT_3488 [Dunaliella salina]|uniref:Uncharacterized protein n=1 Tax=Dunaliella salina TaxID=3046 RepID=A0ABQ7GU25_DUNSA|nr:hypothetical protein DUNSADRAFT_3488 [Dunaliella salina]|eukprot:KAF5838054.1 hypothetical protein DUNSADRAFT_3488 [Dunaliella salina]
MQSKYLLEHRVAPAAAVPQKAEHKRQSSGTSLPFGPALAAFAVSALVVLPQPSTAAMQLPNKEADNDSPMIAELKRRSDEKREERAKERLDDYYRRNYKDYFEFINGGSRSPSSGAISEWLKQNSK